MNSYKYLCVKYRHMSIASEISNLRKHARKCKGRLKEQLKVAASFKSDLAHHLNVIRGFLKGRKISQIEAATSRSYINLKFANQLLGELLGYSSRLDDDPQFGWATNLANAEKWLSEIKARFSVEVNSWNEVVSKNCELYLQKKLRR